MSEAVDFSNIILPSEDWLERQQKLTRFTPDMAALDKKAFHLLFLYCNAQKGFSYYDLIKEHSVTYAAAFTQQPFTTFTKKLGDESFPIAFEFGGFTTVPRVPIKGSLMLVEPAAFLKLDKFKLNGEEFQRTRKKVIIPYRRTRNSRLSNLDWDRYVKALNIPDNYDKIIHYAVVDAWFYVGIETFWRPLLDAGYTTSPTYTYENKKLGRYYCFTNKELRRG